MVVTISYDSHRHCSRLEGSRAAGDRPHMSNNDPSIDVATVWVEYKYAWTYVTPDFTALLMMCARVRLHAGYCKAEETSGGGRAEVRFMEHASFIGVEQRAVAVLRIAGAVR